MEGFHSVYSRILVRVWNIIDKSAGREYTKNELAATNKMVVAYLENDVSEN